MPDANETTRRGNHRLVRIVAVLCAVLCLALIGVYLLFAVYLRTPAAARHVSRLLTEYLHAPVTVAGLRLAGGTFSATGLTVGSPAGFKERELVSAREIAITPGWRTLLRGGRSIGEISLTGLRITLGKNESGVWNFSELARSFSGKKGGGETFIKRLSVTDSSLSVKGVLIDKLGLTVTDFSTKGSTSSRLLLTFKDAGGTPVRLEGSGRPGSASALDLTLSAPSVSLSNYRKFAQKWPVLDLGEGTGAVSLHVKLNGGKIEAQGKMGVDHVALNAGKGTLPLKADLEFAAGYDSSADEATLESCSLRLNGIVGIHAAGRMQQVRKSRAFAAAISLDDMDVGQLLAMLPSALRGDFRGGGRLSSTGFRFSGDAAHGMTAGGGRISLAGGGLAKGGTFVARDLAGDIFLTRTGAGWEVSGRVSQGEKGAIGGVVEGLNARFEADFSSRMKLLEAGMPSAIARISGIAVQGTVAYRPGSSEPLTADLAAKKTPAAALNRFLAGKAAFSAGTATLSLQVSGRSVREFRGTLQGDLKDIQGRTGEKSFAVRDGSIDAEISASGGKPAASGHVRCSGALVDGKAVDVASTFGIRDGEFLLSDGSVTIDRTRLRFASIRGPMPVRVRQGEVDRRPLHLRLVGVTVQNGDALIDNLAGDLGADLVSGHGRRWLTGSGSLSAARLVYKGQDAGSLEGRLNFSESGMIARLDGTLLGGRMQGTAGFNPLDPKKRAQFSLGLAGAQFPALLSFVPARQGVKITDGVLDATLAGTYSADAGVQCRVEAKGGGIVLAGKEGNPLLTGGTLHTVSEVDRDRLAIREGSVGTGNGVALAAKGEVIRFLSPDREGVVSLSLPTIPLNSLLHTVAAVFPARFRDVTAVGTIGGEWKLRFGNRRVMFDGEASLVQGGFEIPAQKIGAAGLTGTLPVSLAIAGDTSEKHEKSKYPQEPYAALLSTLRNAAKSAHTFRIGALHFGGLAFGETELGITAGNGLVEITALDAKFLEGALLGRGYFRYGKSNQYGAELALNSLSLRALCNAYPKITGYISGKVDGVMDLQGEGKGLNGLVGIVNIWTRSAPDEKMLVSKEFLQKLAGKNLKGLFFQDDRPYDHGEIHGYLEKGYLVFDVLDISHTNFFGVKDLSVSVAPVQNKIAIEHLIASIKEAATRGKAAGKREEAEPAPAPPPEKEFKWEE